MATSSATSTRRGTSPSTETTFVHPNGVRLLSLDGGGVRGIASLIILNEIMKRVQKKMNLPKMPPPADYFDLTAGTSAGGINTIMLFRLRMTTEEAIKQYHILSKDMFRPTVNGWRVPIWMEDIVSNLKLFFLGTRFDTFNLEEAIDNIVAKYGLDEADREKRGNAPLFHPEANKMFLCTTVKNKMETALLRSYVKNFNFTLHNLIGYLKQEKDHITIKLAVRATSAAPTYFPAVRHKGLVFWDGGLLNNNPIDQLWYERYDLVGTDEGPPPVSCVISLGTGHKKPGDEPPSLWFKLLGIASSVMAFATTTHAKDKKFESHMFEMKRRPGFKHAKYIRFDTPLKHDIGLVDYRQIDLLAKKTYEFLQTPKQQKKLIAAVEAICPPPRRDSLMDS
ncbi:hypothetical protein BGZ67_007042 [Mortierella alpina]|nr:hypothetical protein BGZ67_007042 [Mortierella alpina]